MKFAAQCFLMLFAMAIVFAILASMSGCARQAVASPEVADEYRFQQAQAAEQDRLAEYIAVHTERRK